MGSIPSECQNGPWMRQPIVALERLAITGGRVASRRVPWPPPELAAQAPAMSSSRSWDSTSPASDRRSRSLAAGSELNRGIPTTPGAGYAGVWKQATFPPGRGELAGIWKPAARRRADGLRRPGRWLRARVESVVREHRTDLFVLTIAFDSPDSGELDRCLTRPYVRRRHCGARAASRTASPTSGALAIPRSRALELSGP